MEVPTPEAFSRRDSRARIPGSAAVTEASKTQSAPAAGSSTDTPEEVAKVKQEAVEEKEANRVHYVTAKPCLNKRIGELVL